MVGTVTNVVTAVEVTESNVHDSVMLAPLVQRTAANFNVHEVSADKGYLGHANLATIEAIGAVPYIPFKNNSTPKRVSRLAAPLAPVLVQEGRVSGPLPQAQQRRDHVLDDQAQVRHWRAVETTARAIQRGLAQVPLPQPQRPRALDPRAWCRAEVLGAPCLT